jgi:HAD superfamily hydrolase (TIGR01490 family)
VQEILPKLERMREAAVPAPSDNPIVAFFDVDNTLLRGASIFHVAKAARRRGLVTYRELLRFAWHQATFLFIGENHRHLSTIQDRAMELLDGYTEAELTAIANEVFERDIQPRLWPETVELTREHLRKGHAVWLITASPQIVAQVIADRLGLTGALGTRLEAVDGVFTGRLVGAMLHGERKAIAARELIAGTTVDLADCWAYSDSRNDIPLLSLAGNRMVVNPDSQLTRHAKKHGWRILQLKRSSIRAAQRLVRTEARVATGSMRPRRVRRPKA